MTTEATQAPIVTVPEATTLLNQLGVPWSVDTVYRMLRFGKLPFGERLGERGDWMIHRADVERFARGGWGDFPPKPQPVVSTTDPAAILEQLGRALISAARKETK